MLIHEESYNIRSYEADTLNRVHLVSLANYLQDTADRHAAALGVSVPQLLARGLSWVLHRMQLVMHQLPQYADTITVKTYPSGIERIYLYRDFYIYNQAGLLIGEATSTWLVIDIAKRQLTSVPADVLAKFEPFRALPQLPRVKEKLPSFEAKLTENQTILVRKNEFDHNSHVNNSAYFQWLLEPLNDAFLEQHTLKSVDIVFKNECQRGDVVQSLAQQLNPQKILHQLQNQSGAGLVQAVSIWEAAAI